MIKETEGDEIILQRYLHSHIYGSITHSNQDMETTYQQVNRFKKCDICYNITQPLKKRRFCHL